MHKMQMCKNGQSAKKYILVLASGHTSQDYTYRDLIERDDVTLVYSNYVYDNWLINLIQRMHKSTVANRLFNLPFKSIWNNLEGIVSAGDDDSVYLFSSEALEYFTQKQLNDIELRRNSKFVLILLDSLNASSAHIRKIRPFIQSFRWDAVLSFDKDDCAEYGFKWLGYSYYSKHKCDSISAPQSDIYYIGRIHGQDRREELVKKIYYKCINNKVVCDFNIVRSKKNQEVLAGLHERKRAVPYSTIIDSISKTNCILEILQKGQNHQTLRYFEAICYNKKLVTNNHNTIHLPYYDERYIKIINSEDDLDVEWIKKKEIVDYGYKGDFSSSYLIGVVNEALNKNGD